MIFRSRSRSLSLPLSVPLSLSLTYTHTLTSPDPMYLSPLSLPPFSACFPIFRYSICSHLGRRGCFFSLPSFFLSPSLSYSGGYVLFVYYFLFVCFGFGIFLFFRAVTLGLSVGPRSLCSRDSGGAPHFLFCLFFFFLSPRARGGGTYCQIREDVTAVRSHRSPAPSELALSFRSPVPPKL